MIVPEAALPKALHPYGDALTEATARALNRMQTRADQLEAGFSRLAGMRPSQIELDTDWVKIGRAEDLTAAQQGHLDEALYQLKPWRKGPFEVFGRKIDSEWKSSLKWRRLAPHIAALTGRKILDVGSSNGYYGFRMAAHGPQLILGIEPYATHYFQFRLLQGFAKIQQLQCLPLKLVDLTPIRNYFDTVFCMGVLYHSRSPLDMLAQLHVLLAPGGELVLETLIIESSNESDESAFFPSRRYARMRNIFFVPTVRCLHNWLERTRFDHVRCVDITRTTLNEQRRTPWIDSESLDAFLDPADPMRTIEGYPAPVRAIVIANKRRNSSRSI
jgi:tRNA (mo5U34)-methyltransferase